MAEFQLDENQNQPMDWKRRGERFEYDTTKPLDEQPNPAYNIETGFTTQVVEPSYGLVRERSYKLLPEE